MPKERYTQIYVPWGLRERLRLVAKDEKRSMVALIELMLDKRVIEKQSAHEST